MQEPSRIEDPSAGLAVLVDCENMPPTSLAPALKWAQSKGAVGHRLAFGKKPCLEGRWAMAMKEALFEPRVVDTYASGKNAADIALALAALELHLAHGVRAFCVISSDSDFGVLAACLRARGASIYLAADARAPEAYRQVADDFFLIELEPQKPKTAASAPACAPARAPAPAPVPVVPADLQSMLVSVARSHSATAQAPVLLTNFGEALRRAYPDYPKRIKGLGRLSSVVQKTRGLRLLGKSSSMKVCLA